MSQLTRLASTNSQENSITAVERAFKKAHLPTMGFTTIGKSPQTVIIDIQHQDSKIYVDSDGQIEIDTKMFSKSDIIGMAQAITEIRNSRSL